MGLAASEVSLRDKDTGLNVVTFDIDPETYDPFAVPIRGTSKQTLDGGVVHQVFGLRVKDFRLTLTGRLTHYDTLQALWTKYRQSATGQEFELRDWYPNRFVVAFAPGADSFHPVYVPGSCEAHTYQMVFVVCEILEFFGGAY